MATISNLTLPRLTTGASVPRKAPPVQADRVETPRPQESLTTSAEPLELTPRVLRWEPAASLVNPKAEQLARATESSWHGTACSGVAELASRYFSSTEFQALNSGTYHNFEHPLVVADAAGAFGQGLGWSADRKQFIQQVALLHDADDRSQVDTGEVRTGTPARAPVAGPAPG